MAFSAFEDVGAVRGIAQEAARTAHGAFRLPGRRTPAPDADAPQAKFAPLREAARHGII